MIRNSHSHTPFLYHAMKITPSTVKVVVEVLIMAGQAISDAVKRRKQKRKERRENGSLRSNQEEVVRDSSASQATSEDPHAGVPEGGNIPN